jgi:rhodanese-related sulfurtransferase
VACDPADLPEHHVCLSTVREWPEDEVLWVDARPREKWQDDGVEGSILINDQEEWMMMVPELIGQMAIAPRPRVVVYCDQEGCGSSKYVANQLRKEHAGPLGFEVFVLYGGIAALQEEER